MKTVIILLTWFMLAATPFADSARRVLRSASIPPGMRGDTERQGPWRGMATGQGGAVLATGPVMGRGRPGGQGTAAGLWGAQGDRGGRDALVSAVASSLGGGADG
jgi:hypothetical protein